MAVTYNIKGTTNSSFKVGKSGTGTAYLNTLSGDTIAVTSNLAVDTNTLYVDAVNNRVGIGKTDPGLTLDVAGTLNVSSYIVSSTYMATTEFKPNVNDGAVLGTSSSGFSDLYLADGAVIYLGNDQDTTITHTPDTGITLNNNLTVSGNLTVQGATTSVSSTTIEVKDKFVFEGATDDSNELTLQAADPTSDRTITLPDETGILIVKDTVTGMIQLPVGTTAERPTPSAGMMRFNSTTKRFEGYNGIDWVPLSSSPNDLTSRDGTEVNVHASDFGKIT